MAEKEAVRTEEAPAPFQGAPYSQAIKAGGLVFVSGQVALVPGATEPVGSDVREQTEQVFANLRAILEAVGSGLDRVVKTTVYLLDGQDRSVFLDAYGEQFRRRLRSPWMPAGLTMTVDALRPDCLVEIDAMAWLGAR